ncbi:MAG: hypothetical protein RLN75_03270 [Longimicrobiales bacterium]
MAPMPSHRSVPVFALAAFLLTGPAPSAGAAQEPPAVTVLAARMRAAIDPVSGRAEVRIAYTVSGRPSTPIRIEGLDFGPATVRAVRLEGTTGPLALDPESGHLRATELPAAPVGDSVVVTYTVEGAVQADGADVRLRLPVVVLDLPPYTADGPVFRAIIDVPDEWAVSGAFPTGLARTPDGAWQVDLAVVPSLVSLRGRTDGAWRPGLPGVLDALALDVLLAFGLAGARHLRGVVRRAEARP